MKEFQRCNRCVMDNSADNTIIFDEKGNCNYCTYALERRSTVYFPNKEGENKLQSMLSEIKGNSKQNDYDCIMGISGGLDSAYLLYLATTKWNLKVLPIHIDDGFNAPVAVENIHNLCESCNVELITIKADETQYIDLTRSFFLAGLPGICIPQDNIYVAGMFHAADKYGINYFLSGTNFALESVLQRGNMHNACDLIHIKAVHKKFGNGVINKLQLLSLTDRYIKYKYIKKQHYVRPLDWINYNKNKAIEELKAVGFNYYEGKHYENILTKFLQVYYLPKKYNIDMRKSHISSLIVSGQMTRSEALKELSKPLFNEEVMEQEISFILNKLNLSREQFVKIMSDSPKQHSDYKMSRLIKYSGLARKYRNYLSD